MTKNIDKPTRIETDSMGDVNVLADAVYAAQTQRAINNFPISGQTMPDSFIKAVIHIKQAAAESNKTLNLLEAEYADAIIATCESLLEHSSTSNFKRYFPVDVFQTGSGTSTNMNANEVIANLASDKLGKNVNPNDHVNMSQSSNDVIPTAIQLSAAIGLTEELLPAITYLIKVIHKKAKGVDKYVKTGRTHLMDAMPIRMSQELEGWAEQLVQSKENIDAILPSLYRLAQGGTAVGSGINAHKDFGKIFAKKLSSQVNLPLTPSRQFFASIAGQDSSVALSGQLKTIATALMKISNDLRWMNSGPLAGLGEIALESLQPGSSIMPGKVNPVIPEAVTMVAAQVIGNDTTITIAGQSGNFQLNVMLPIIAYNLNQSVEILSNSMILLADKAIATFEVRQDSLDNALSKNPILVTALNPKIGYLKAAEIAKKAYAEGLPILEVAERETDLSLDELKKLLNPKELTYGGIK